jgi:hypothetical protein
MAAFCWFYHFTPSEFYALSLREYGALIDFLNKYLEAQRG